MKTIQLIPLYAALFWACSDSSDVSGATIIDNTMAQDTLIFSMSTKHGLKLGSCRSNEVAITEEKILAKQASPAYFEKTSEESIKAYMLYNSKGDYQVLLLNVRDYCSVSASIETTRFGDTLEIEYGGIPNENGERSIAVSACTCNRDHWFDINAKDKDVKFIRFKKNTYEISGDPILVHTRDESDYPVLTDPRDGKTYKTIVIYEQLWMAENLNYETEDGAQSWCYENKQENCDKNGRLYTFEAAKTACPPGWHIPSDPEWGELIMYNYTEKSIWEDIAMQPLGEYSADSLKFIEPGETTQFWTSSLDTLHNDCHSTAHFTFDKESPEHPHSVRSCPNNENDGLPLRCMKD